MERVPASEAKRDSLREDFASFAIDPDAEVMQLVSRGSTRWLKQTPDGMICRRVLIPSDEMRAVRDLGAVS